MFAAWTPRWIALIAVLIAAPPMAIRAEIYYVDSLEGNDRYNGQTDRSPWQSIARVNAQTLHPGDSILFRRGREWYDVSIKVRTRDLMLGAYGDGAPPKLIGGVKIFSWLPGENGTYRIPIAQEWGVQLVFQEGGPFYRLAAKLEPDLSPGTFYYDKKKQELYIKPKGEQNPNGQTFIVGSQNHVVELERDDVDALSIKDLEISYANRYGISPWWQGAHARHGTVEISHCLFVGNAFSAIAFSGRATYERLNIHHNIIRSNGAEGIYIGPNSARGQASIADNIIGSKSDEEFGWRGEGAHSAFNGDGIDIKPGNHGVVVQRNTITNITGGYGIGILSGGSLVEDNIISDVHIPHGETSGIYVDVHDSFGLATVRHNAISGSQSYGIVVRGSTELRPAALIENNSIILSSDNPYAQMWLTSRDKKRITVRLNRGRGGAYGIYMSGDSPSHVIIQDNQLLHAKTAWRIDPGKLEGLTAHRNAVCMETLSIIEWRGGDRVQDMRRAKEILGSDDSIVTMPCSSERPTPSQPSGLLVR